MYRQAARSQNAKHHASFSNILADRQKQQPRRKPKAKKRRGKPKRGPLITFTKKERAELDVLVAEVRRAVDAAREARDKRIARQAVES